MNQLVRSTFRMVQPLVKFYLRRDRYYRHGDKKLLIRQGVFHPGLFFSTRFLLHRIQQEPLKDQLFCEVGAGSGVISFAALEMGAKVVSIDINPTAVKGLQENLVRHYKHHSDMQVFCSDMFDKLPACRFNYIVVNPPYFFREPKDDEARAWCCGNNGEFFRKFFSSLGERVLPNAIVFMVLAENCDIDRIKAIASQFGWKLTLDSQKQIWTEDNYIFTITHERD